MIPKRIIQIYSAPPGRGDEVPLVGQASAASLRLLHPDFEYILFDKNAIEAFLQNEPAAHREAYHSFAFPIQRFDFFRYLAIHKLGGFYFDLDIFLARDVTPLLKQACVFPFEELTLNEHLMKRCSFDWEIANYGFGAGPGNPFIRAVIENCIRGQKDPQWSMEMMKGIPRWFRGQFIVPFSTGPGLVTRTFAENTELQKNVTILFPPDVRNKAHWQRFGSFGVHLMQSSWRKRDGFLRSRLSRLWETSRRKNYEQMSAALGPNRSGNWSSLN